VREMIDWIAAEAERVEGSGVVRRRGRFSHEGIEDLPAHTFPVRGSEFTTEGHGENQNPEIENSNAVEDTAIPEPSWEEERERRIYRARTVTMLRRYMRYSIETGRLPSLLGREFFRTRVTSYTVVTFEDRVIFVHDMETSLNKLVNSRGRSLRDIFCRNTIRRRRPGFWAVPNVQFGVMFRSLWTC
jgi:hypothetical protein